ncbi:MAG: hypothetical protein RLZZ401_632, partial [Pseudomonadota bacterium]
MTASRADKHVYLRDLHTGERNSLSVLVQLIAPGARVLDLGTGSGALGHHLTTQQACTVDGVTYNEAEAAHARPHYRRLEVADLDAVDLAMLLAGETYDAIVCADVLEHLKAPERVLAACQALLAPGGTLLISIPNAAYCGLIGELLAGDFKYREEGLLDSTHLRFFTRRSLLRFLSSAGWATDKVDTITRALTAS